MVALASVTVGPSAAADVVSQTVEELLKQGRWAKANDPAAHAMRCGFHVAILCARRITAPGA